MWTTENAISFDNFFLPSRRRMMQTTSKFSFAMFINNFPAPCAIIKRENFSYLPLWASKTRKKHRYVIKISYSIHHASGRKRERAAAAWGNKKWSSIQCWRIWILNRARDSEEYEKCWWNSKQTLCNASLLINTQSQKPFFFDFGETLKTKIKKIWCEPCRIINFHRWNEWKIISINNKDQRMQFNDKREWKFSQFSLMFFYRISMNSEIYESLKASQGFHFFTPKNLFSCDLILRFRRFY